jgi:hypothetical protein
MASQRTLPYVDPAAPQKPLCQAMLRLMSTRAMVAEHGRDLAAHQLQRDRLVLFESQPFHAEAAERSRSSSSFHAELANNVPPFKAPLARG